jgi:hypothetical protein
MSISTAVIWGSVPPTEHLEHEKDNLKLNVWCALTQETVISLFFFADNIIAM